MMIGLVNNFCQVLILDLIRAVDVNSTNSPLHQYYSPYLTCDMNKMAEAFNTNIEELELELMKLVADQPVRIDSHNKVIYY